MSWLREFFRVRKLKKKIREVQRELDFITLRHDIEDDLRAILILEMLKKLRALEVEIKPHHGLTVQKF